MSDWYKREPSKFIGGVVGLGAEAIGAYAVILDLIYQHDGPIQNDPRWIGGILGCSMRKTASLIERLVEAGKIDVRDGKISNRKAEQVIESRVSFSRERAESGSKGGRNSHETSARGARDEQNKGDVKRKNNDLAEAELPLEREEREERKKDSSDEEKAIEEYQRIAEQVGLTKIVKLTDKRKSHLRARLAEFGLDGWTRALRSIPASDFLSGRAGRGWKPDFDWLVNPNNFAKVIEGKYAGPGSAPAAIPAGGNGQARPGEYQARDPADFDLDDWTVRIRLYRQNGKWAETWGPRPPAEGDISDLARGYLQRHRRAA